MSLFKRVDTVFLPVLDLDAAVTWYTETFGFNLRWKQGGYAAIDAGETPFTLHEPEEGFTPVKRLCFNFYTTDLEAARRRLEAAGASIGSASEDAQFGFFEFTDPDGNLLGVCWYPEQTSP
ncbi:MAG: VOC family protein [Bacillota bacterium]